MATEAHRVITKITRDACKTHFLNPTDSLVTLCGIDLSEIRLIEPAAYVQTGWTDKYQWFDFDTDCQKCARHADAPCYDPHISDEMRDHVDNGSYHGFIADRRRLTNHRWTKATHAGKRFCNHCGRIEEVA